MNSLSRLIEVLPNGIFGADKSRILTEAPYVVLIKGCDAEIETYQDFKFGGKLEWCKHRVDAIADTKQQDIAKLFIDTKAKAATNFKLAFFEKKVDVAGDSLLLLYEAKLVVRGLEYFDDNIVKLVVLRNQLTHTSLSEHLIYMDKAEV